MAKSLLSTLDADKRSEVEDLVRESIGDHKVTQSSYESSARAMKRSRYVASSHDRYEVRRQDLILFVEQTLEGEPAKDTGVTCLREDLLDPSFRIGKEIDVEMFLKEFDKVNKDSKRAERRFKSKKKEELKQAGEMFRKRVGHGISTAYCAFGLRKANRSWFTDSTGKSWLNLQTRNQSD